VLVLIVMLFVWLMDYVNLLDLNRGTYSIVNMDYCVELWQWLTCKLSWVAHFAMDIVSDLMMVWH
jgi:hypothetical protein